MHPLHAELQFVPANAISHRIQVLPRVNDNMLGPLIRWRALIPLVTREIDVRKALNRRNRWIGEAENSGIRQRDEAYSS